MIVPLLGRILSRIHPGRSTMAGALRAAAPRHPVRTVIDVGASDGRWTALARRSFPAARALLIEAQANPHEPALRRYVARDPLSEYVIAAAGPREGTIHFDASDPWGGVASEEPTGAHDAVVPVTTVDAEVARRGLPPPYLLKLDTHGFELPILSGAARTLESAALLVIEAYNFTLRPGAVRFPELCRILEERGFRCLDVADPLRRSDGALWQLDMFFAPAWAEEFRRDTWA